jgi:uncharacterized protein YndB with AHSA1/START domain
LTSLKTCSERNRGHEILPDNPDLRLSARAGLQLVGGGFTQKMQIAGKSEFTITGKYDEIVAPEKIVYRADLGFGVTRVQVEFVEHGSQTKVVLTQEGFPDDFLSQTVTQGTTESFDKLESILAREAQMSQ